MRFRKFVLGGGTLMVAALLGMQLGCSKSQEMRTGYGGPIGEGTVNATGGDNGSTNLEVQVKHLAQPSLLADGATVYVVWVQPRNSVRQNVGALTMTDELEGSLKTVTPHRQFTLSVTPEVNSFVDRPRNEPVFTASVDRSS